MGHVDRARISHCLLGGALGDAWGGPYENQAGPVNPVFPSNPILSDDTLLVLATCEAIIERRGVVAPHAIAGRFLQWFQADRLVGLGSSTLKALRDLARGAHWALAGARGEFAAGSGTAMRAAPLAFFLDPERDADRLVMRDVSRITHHSDEAYAGVVAVVAGIRACAAGDGVPADLLARVADVLPDTAVRDRLLELDGSGLAPRAAALEFGCSGHVVDAVPLALYFAAAPHESMEHLLCDAISVGGDADTIASISAQLAGASGLPPPNAKLGQLPELPMATSIIETFSDLAQRCWLTCR